MDVCKGCAFEFGWTQQSTSVPNECKGCQMVDGKPSNYKPKPQTNADRIRAMSDEKLADAWIRCNTICHLCAYRDECEFDEYVIYEKCKEGIMEWLKQPADMRGEEDG